MKIQKVLTLSLLLFLLCIQINLVKCQRYYSITPNTYFWRSNPIFTLSSVRSPIICFNRIQSISDSANILVVERFKDQKQSFTCNAYTLNSYANSITLESDNSTLYTFGSLIISLYIMRINLKFYYLYVGYYQNSSNDVLYVSIIK
jgi:hypothetical protein